MNEQVGVLTMSRQNLRLNLLTTVAALCFSSTLHAQAIEEVVKSAIDSHPTVKSTEAAQAAAYYDSKIARTAWLPSVAVTAQTGWENNNSSSTTARASRGTGLGDQSGPSDVDQWGHKAGVIVTQNLLDFGATDSAIKAADYRQEVAALRTAVVREEIAFRVIQAYLDTVKNRELVKLTQENIDWHNDMIKLISDGIKSGVKAKSDLDVVKSKLDTQKDKLEEQKSDLRQSEARYKFAVGAEPGEVSWPKPPTDSAEETLEMMLDYGISNSFIILTGRANSASKVAEIDTAKATFFPKFVAELNHNRGLDNDGTDGHKDQTTALLKMTYSPYVGGGDVLRKEKAYANLAQAYATEDEAVRVVEQRIRVAHAKLGKAKKQLSTWKKGIGSAQKALDGTRRNFDIGQKSLNDVLDALNTLTQAKTQYISRNQEFILGHYELEVATGRLLRTFGVPSDNPLDVQPLKNK